MRLKKSMFIRVLQKVIFLKLRRITYLSLGCVNFMSKKLIILIIVFSLLTFTSITYATTRYFTDVSSDRWYAKTIDEAHKLGIVNGYDNQTFKPEDYITRAEATKIALNVLNAVSNNIKYITEEDQLIINSIAKTLPRTVYIQSGNYFGSGFFVSDKYILTNWHVVSDTSDGTVQVKMFDGKELIGKIVKSDIKRDLALVEVDVQENMSDIKYANEVSLGETIIVIGNPLGLEFTVTKGIVSHLDRKFNDYKFIQIDASVNGGNSGGIVIDSNGNLVGVVKSKVEEIGVEGLGFIIPYENVKSFTSGVAK